MHTAIFGESPLGLPTDVHVEYGGEFRMGESAAETMQRLVWQLLPDYARLGLTRD